MPPNLRELHDEAVLLGYELRAPLRLGHERREVEAHAEVRRAYKVFDLQLRWRGSRSSDRCSDIFFGRCSLR